MMDLPYLFSMARRALLLAGLLITSACALLAQPDGPPPPPGGMQRGAGIERQLNHLTQMLALTDTQQSQIKALLLDQRQQMETLRRSMQADSDQTTFRDKTMAIREATNTKIAAVLTEEQKPKFAAWIEQQKNMWEHHQQRQQNQGPPPQGEAPGF